MFILSLSLVSGSLRSRVNDPKEHDETVASLDTSYSISDREETTLMKHVPECYSRLTDQIQQPAIKQGW